MLQFDRQDFQSLMYSFGQMIFSLAFLLLLVQIQGVESQLVEQKKEIIFFINRAKDIDVMFMVFYLTVGYLSSFAINATLTLLFKRGFEAPSVKEPDLFDQMFSFDSFYDAVMHLSVSGLLFKTILWVFIMVALCTFTLSLYGVWSSLSARTRMNITRVSFTLSAAVVSWFALLFGLPHELIAYCADSDTLVPDGTGPLQQVWDSTKDAALNVALNVSSYSLKLLQQVWDSTMGRSMAESSRELGIAHRQGMVESAKIAVGGALGCITLHHMWQIARFALRARGR